MPQQTMYPAAVNSLQTELAAAVDATQTTIAVADASLLPAAPNLAVIGSDETAETILYTGRSGNSLTGITRGFQGTAKGWSAGIKVARYFTAYDHDTFRGNIQDLGARMDATESALPLRSISRQAIINGGFDVAQRGVSVTQNGGSFGPENAYGYGLDRWIGQVYAGVGSTGTASFTMSQQQFAAGQTAVPGNPKYFGRLSVMALGNLGTSSGFIRFSQFIESVYTFAGQKCTASFWAKSSSARQIAVSLHQYYGNGGSASPAVSCPGGRTINLTTSWQFFTITFDVPSIAGKTLGTNKNDYLGLYFIPYKQDDSVVSIPSGEVGTFATGDFDFAQVQLCAGDVALPFQPRSFAEELALCQRYYEKSYNISDTPGAITSDGALGWEASGSTFTGTNVIYKVKKRMNATITLYSPGTGLPGKIYNQSTNADVAALPERNGENGFKAIVNNVGVSATQLLQVHYTADAEL